MMMRNMLRQVKADGFALRTGFVEKACWRLDMEDGNGRWGRMEADTREVRWMAAHATIGGNLYVT